VIQVVAHTLVGLGVALVASRILRKRSALGVAILAMIGHELLDEPVTKALHRFVKGPSGVQ
jgi:hypothetical protein